MANLSRNFEAAAKRRSGHLSAAQLRTRYALIFRGVVGLLSRHGLLPPPRRGAVMGLGARRMVPGIEGALDGEHVAASWENALVAKR